MKLKKKIVNFFYENYNVNEKKFLEIFTNIFFINIFVSVLCFLIAPQSLNFCYGEGPACHLIQISRIHLLWAPILAQLSLLVLIRKDISDNNLIGMLFFISFIPLITTWALISQYLDLNQYNLILTILIIIIFLSVFSGLLMNYFKKKMGVGL
ncbi:MAG: hypothetical protein Q8N63_02195 [Nanoarchaeota archaeon]|nr:hypothetical protein [Nanoarchaeota archaeon]